MYSLAWFLLGLPLGQRRATVICTRHDFQSKLFRESDFGRVIAIDSNALEDVPERTLQLVVALGWNRVSVAHCPRPLVLGHRRVIDRAEQRCLLLGRSVDEILAKEILALLIHSG